MTPEDIIVCLCTRQDFDAVHQRQLVAMCQARQIEWDAVFAVAEQHGVAPLVYINLSKSQNGALAIPQATLDQFKKAYIHNVFVKRGTAAILDQVLALFARKGIDVMLVKGAALNLLVYEKPWYTRSYDVDLVIRARKEELDEADQREITEVLEGFNHQPNRFREHIEYDYYEHHDVTMNNVLAVDSERLWQDARRIRVSGYDAFVLAPEDTLIAAAVNSCRKRFFWLKSLCDIATIIDQSPDLDWEMLVNKARAYECHIVLYTALCVTQGTLGCSLPEPLLSDLKVNPLRALVIRRLVRLLSQTMSLSDLFARSEESLLGRKFSWPLALTYATYRTDHVFSKLREIYRAWRNPPPPVPNVGFETVAMSEGSTVNTEPYT